MATATVERLSETLGDYAINLRLTAWEAKVLMLLVGNVSMYPPNDANRVTTDIYDALGDVNTLEAGYHVQAGESIVLVPTPE